MGEFFLKLLDWPFLLFLGIGLIARNYKAELGALISRGGISLTWGDKSFEIAELPEQLNESFAPMSDDIDDLKARINVLEKALNQDDGGAKKGDSNAELTPQQTESAREQMLEALESGKYTWRSIERLSTIGAVTISQASDILRPMQEVKFGRGKSGRTIVKLLTRG